MFAICWNERPKLTWTGQGYGDAPWQTRTYADRGEAARIASRINGRVCPWHDRRGRKDRAQTEAGEESP